MRSDGIPLWVTVAYWICFALLACWPYVVIDQKQTTPTHAYIQGIRDALHECEHVGAVMVQGELVACVVKAEAE